MRKPVLAVGIIILALGGFLVAIGPESRQVPYTDYVTSDKSSPIFSSETYTVQPREYRYWYLSVDLSGKDSGTTRIKGSYAVSGGYGVNFYILNSANFNLWKGGSSSTALVRTTNLQSYTFDSSVSSSDTYYFVFDNTYSTLASKTFTVTANLVWEETKPVTKYETVYDRSRNEFGGVLAVIGLVITIAGAAAKGKKAPPPPAVMPAPPPPVAPPVQPSPPPPVYQPPPPPPGFKRCPHCGTQMPVQATFCGVCGRRIL